MVGESESVRPCRPNRFAWLIGVPYFCRERQRYVIGRELVDRLVNVASSVYGKVYFPIRSNGLKSLGRFLGATWTDPEASGLQSLAWRHSWEVARSEGAKKSLLQYNRDDCEAIRVLVDRLDRLRRDAESDPSIEFASRPKRYATETGKAIHGQFDQILKFAGMDSGTRGIHLRQRNDEEGEPRKRGARKGHQGYRRVIPSKVNRVIRVPPKRACPKGHGNLILLDAGELSERTITDLAFSKGGCRRTVTRYEGKKGYCQKCDKLYDPPAIVRLGNQSFGHAFRAWAVYQRIVLRLPCRIIAQVTEHLFGVGLSMSTPINFLRDLASYYAPTEAAMLQAILKSAFVHVDETQLSIQGVDHYVWVFTDGQHVVFRMTETREADIVRETLSGYHGVLVSDFYPGYDGVPCRQQKCLVHLIRDINDDLWKAPFDKELEAFAAAVQSLLMPILTTVDHFGLKAWHLRKFNKDVERFYDKNITGREYRSEATESYRKRFDRYQGSLFTFLNEDAIPWNNNMAERAIRQLAVQRKISGSFFRQSAGHYLLLLAISQTCRFQGKSFLKFLLSKEIDVDSFRWTRPVRYSYAVSKREDCVLNEADGTPSTEGHHSEDAAEPQRS
jgi:transposase